MAYQVLLEHRRGEQTMLIRAQMYTGTTHGWLTVDEWMADIPSRVTAKTRETLAQQTCSQRGWELTSGVWEKDSGGHLLTQVLPANWRQILINAVHRRSELKAAFETADLAWQLLVADTPRKGKPGYVSAIDIAEIAAVTRHRIYQIQGVGKTPGTTLVND